MSRSDRRGRDLSINTFAPVFLNGKWKIENGKFLTVMLNLFQHLISMEVKLSAYKTLKQVQGDSIYSPLIRERIEYSKCSIVSVLGEGCPVGSKIVRFMGTFQ